MIVEKPFGTDRKSARSLNDEIHRYFDEREIYRIDHYLGKETVQNLLALRFANGIFEPLWNRELVDHVEITVAESIGIEGRAMFYESAGAIRDVFQNHLLQLVALTAMEPPVDFTAESVRNEKVKVLSAIRPPGPSRVVRGQYGPGYVEGKKVPGYRQEPGVAPRSITETFVAAKLYVDNWRWAGTPFYVRVGKRLAKRETTIAIQFKRAPHPPFAKEASEGVSPNVLLVHIQPDEGISLAIGAKVPGQGLNLRTVHMDFLYGGAFRTELPEAYERLILDCLLGDATLFTRADEVDAQWALVDSIVASWKRERAPFPNYEAGTWGPEAADELLRKDGRRGGDTDRHLRRGDRGVARRARATTSSRRSGRASPRTWPGSRTSGRGRPTGVMRGLGDRVPSRTLLLHPEPDAEGRRLRRDDHGRPVLRREDGVSVEIVRIRLRGSTAEAPASVVVPLQIADLPVFLRWRGRPAFGRKHYEQLVGVADRLIVDSTEWDRLPSGLAKLSESFDRIAVSDLAWARTLPWRAALADLWPGIKEAKTPARRRPPPGSAAPACLAGDAASAQVPAQPRGRADADQGRGGRRAGGAGARPAVLAERPALRRARVLRARPRVRGGGQSGVT